VDGAADSEDSWEVVGDPTEISLLVAASKINDSVQPRFSRGAYARAAEIPFTSERKRMTVIASTHDADGNNASAWVLSKGAPDVLVRYCSQILDSGEIRDMTADDRFAITRSVEQLSSQAYRTLGMAFRPFDETDKNILDGGSGLGDGISSDIAENPDLIERDLIWAGMVGIIDPPRTEVRDSIAQAHSAGIRTIMITGDHPLTAAKIASDLGINDRVGDRITDRIDDRIGERINELSSPSSPQSPLPSSSLSDIVLTGDQLDELSEEELSQKVSEISVYARVAPEHKMMLVKTLQSQGNIVAMTGDGVNDAPAVKAADIGVAMGITGTEVTKEASEMILADDNFSTIVHAISEGRAIFDNIQKFLRFLLSSNAGEVCTVFAGVLLAGVLGLTVPGSTGITVPLLAVQLLWINLLTDAAPALAIGVDNQHIDIMSRRPRKLTDRVIDKEMWIDIIFVGIIMAAVTLIGMDMHLAGGLFTDRSTSNLDHIHQITEARTMGFTILVFAQLFNALASRSATVSAFKDFFQNRMLWLSIGISVVLQVIVIYIPILNEAFGTTPLGWQAWLECIALASVVLWATELRKLWLRASARRRARA
jgi:magnesium-transporting ATPase (P-type)